MRLRVRAAGFADFELDLEPSATVAEAKIEATAGCDVDPEAMRLIYRGRVLQDSRTLEACGVDGSEAVHVARGRAPAGGGSGLPPAAGSTGSVASSTGTAVLPAGDQSSVQVVVRGPGAVDASLDLRANESLAVVRGRAAALCGLEADHVHLVLRGRLLKDDQATISDSCVASGDVLRVARRAVQQATSSPATLTTTVPNATTVSGSMGSPMPMAWGTGPDSLQALLARQGGGEFVQGRLFPQQEVPMPMEVRLGREVRAMEHQVRRLVEERRVGEAGRGGAPPGRQQEPAAQADEADPELLAHIARTMAEARARGAPVPRAAQFVDRALSRAHDARVLGERLDREASGMDPELEDALTAAEQSAAAAVRAPRRLGGTAPHSNLHG